MKRLILHIGAAKTGTSLIQMHLAQQSSELLEAHDFHYPLVGNAQLSAQGKVTAGNGAPLAKWLNEATPYSFDEQSWDPRTLFETNHTESNMVLSSEFLMGFNEEKLIEFETLAKSYGYELELVAYLRSISGHALSSYAQHIKRAHYKHSFPFFIRKTYKNVFWPLVKKLERVKSIASVRLFNYENYRSSLAEHFFGTVLDLENYPAFESIVINRSLSAIEIDVLMQLNRATMNIPKGKVLTTKVSDYLVENFPTEQALNLIDAKDIQLLERRHQDNVNKINALLPSEEHITVADNNIEVTTTTHALTDREQRIIDIFTKAFEINSKIN